MTALALACVLGLNGSEEFVPSAAQPAPIAAAVRAEDMSTPLQAGTASTALSDGRQLIISRSSDGLFYVDASVGGAKVRFLVDTGANVTVLTRQDAERLGLDYVASRRGNLQTVGGAASTSWARIPRLEIADIPITDVEAAVVDRGLPVSLLGQNALSRLDGMTFSGDRLHIHSAS